MGRMLLLVAVGVVGLLMAGGVEGRGKPAEGFTPPLVEVSMPCFCAAATWPSRFQPPCVQNSMGQCHRR